MSPAQIFHALQARVPKPRKGSVKDLLDMARRGGMQVRGRVPEE